MVGVGSWYGRVVDRCSWMFDAGSWCWSRLVNRCPGFWQCVRLTGSVSMWLLARTASRAWARSCDASAVHTASRTWTGCCIAGVSWSKLVLVAWSRRDERPWWVRLNRVLVLRTKWTDRETVAKICQALAYTKSSELCRAPSCADVSETVAMALPCQSFADVSETVAMALPYQSCAVVSETVAMALPCQSCADISQAVAKALPCQSSAVSSEQARTPRLRLAVS